MGLQLRLRPAGEADLGLLARMNKELVKDEGSRNPMSLQQLAERMRELLAVGWQVDLFEIGGGPAFGYALYQLRRDQYDPQLQVVYLRHFFIDREERGGGLGRFAFELLAERRFPPDSMVELDVLASNPGGLAFWSRLGFSPYATTLKRPARQNAP